MSEKLSEQARETMWALGLMTGPQFLAATLPDGRTVAEALDQGEVAMRVLLEMKWGHDEAGWWTEGYEFPHESPAAALLARLEAET